MKVSIKKSLGRSGKDGLKVRCANGEVVSASSLREYCTLLKCIVGYGVRYGIFVLGAILLLTLTIRFTAPVKDGDFFWHVKYGEYMVENRTIVPDHSIYSWTPADNNIVKCNWIADILLYLMHRNGGLPLLFAFRYLCVFAVIGIVWTFAWQLRQGRDVFTFLILAIVLLSSYGASFLKPEIISMVFMALLSGLYFSVKSALWGRWGAKPFLLYPLIFLVWVNVHEVFIFGLAILGLITFGEILNYMFSRKCALTGRGMRYLLTGALMSLSATFVTPYGFRLHLEYYNSFLRLLSRNDDLCFDAVNAYQTIFHSAFYHTRYVDYWVIMLIFFAALFSVLMWKKKEWDWAILLPSIFLTLIYARYVRATYYWPAFWGMSIIYLQSKVGPYRQITPKVGAVLKSGFILLFLFISSRAIYDARLSPFLNQYLGLGIGYANPVQESAFLKEHKPGNLLYNSYGVGGYLIYDLYPEHKVFIDPRYFPYREWYPEYVEFNNGQMPIDEFQKKYPFDIALMDYHSSKNAINKFILSHEWKPVFYGISAIVFLRKDNASKYDLEILDKGRFNDLRTLHQAYTVFNVAQNLDDLDTSAYILELIKKRFCSIPGYENTVKVCALYQDGLMAKKEGNYEGAFARLNILGLTPNKINANNTLVKLRNWKANQLVRKGEYRKALNLMEATLQVIPGYVVGLYNAGIISYMIETRENSRTIEKGHKPGVLEVESTKENTMTWRNYFERFLKMAPRHPQAWIAREVLEGKGLPSDVPKLSSHKIVNSNNGIRADSLKKD